ncbi:hypothetical protein pdam_00006838 [Pocillopora damicornis]|uniref:Uncharacterized protein n=1 Tax=Pocillopora damicornis TaxID=46731 RepID=A0A3M6TP52_POCDA|nr:hypothetical protein pdam_00006838 [Pocillopora damicornis]
MAKFALRNELGRYIVAIAWMGINIYLFVSAYISLQTSPKNFYLRVIVKVVNYHHVLADSVAGKESSVKREVEARQSILKFIADIDGCKSSDDVVKCES